jgi:hypothetical protein
MKPSKNPPALFKPWTATIMSILAATGSALSTTSPRWPATISTTVSHRVVSPASGCSMPMRTTMNSRPAPPIGGPMGTTTARMCRRRLTMLRRACDSPARRTAGNTTYSICTSGIEGRREIKKFVSRGLKNILLPLNFSSVYFELRNNTSTKLGEDFFYTVLVRNSQRIKEVIMFAKF